MYTDNKYTVYPSEIRLKITCHVSDNNKSCNQRFVHVPASNLCEILLHSVYCYFLMVCHCVASYLFLYRAIYYILYALENVFHYIRSEQYTVQELSMFVIVLLQAQYPALFP